MELWQLDATDLARLIRTGQASARDGMRIDAILVMPDQYSQLNYFAWVLHPWLDQKL